MKRHWPLLIILPLVVICWRESASLQTQRATTATLRTELAASGATSSTRLVAAKFDSQPTMEELAELRASAGRVHRLRGEVTLAQQRHDKLAGIIGKLALRMKSRTNESASAKMPEFPPGYRPRHELADRGNATPETALETFWWAFTEGRAGKMQGLILEAADQPLPPEDVIAKDMKEMFQRFPGFKVVSRDVEANGRVKFGIETGLGGRVFHLMLVPRDNRWLVAMEQSDKF